MKLYTEGLSNYQPWSGAVSTYDTIYNEGKLDALEQLMEEIYPDGMSAITLNDILWFDSEWVFESLGIDTGDEDEDEDED